MISHKLAGIIILIVSVGFYNLGSYRGSTEAKMDSMQQIYELKLKSNQIEHEYEVKSMEMNIKFQAAKKGIMNMDSIFDIAAKEKGSNFNVSPTDTNRINDLIDSLLRESRSASDSLE